MTPAVLGFLGAETSRGSSRRISPHLGCLRGQRRHTLLSSFIEVNPHKDVIVLHRLVYPVVHHRISHRFSRRTGVGRRGSNLPINVIMNQFEDKACCDLISYPSPLSNDAELLCRRGRRRCPGLRLCRRGGEGHSLDKNTTWYPNHLPGADREWKKRELGRRNAPSRPRARSTPLGPRPRSWPGPQPN
jgi:hypothetical protein